VALEGLARAEAYGYKAPDTGIDLVAKLREDEGFCAIQCKFYETPIPLGDLGNFFTLSGKGGFTQRLIVATANLSKHAADALENQTIPVEMMTWRTWTPPHRLVAVLAR
jgi:predicted helicase